MPKTAASRRDFLADFSHEVRTPLAGISSAIESLEAGGLTKEDEEQLQKIITRQLGRLERLVRDLSELNELESGGIVLHRKPVDLFELAGEVAVEARPVAEIAPTPSGKRPLVVSKVAGAR